MSQEISSNNNSVTVTHINASFCIYCILHGQHFPKTYSGSLALLPGNFKGSFLFVEVKTVGYLHEYSLRDKNLVEFCYFFNEKCSKIH